MPVHRDKPLRSDAASPLRRQVAVLTGGGDRPYALGLAACLLEQGITFDFIGSDDLEEPALHQDPRVRFLNLRGDQRPDVSVVSKGVRVAKYYLRLLRYALTAEAQVFHILWNNKFELLDRTALMLFYKLMGKRIVFTDAVANKEFDAARARYFC